MTSASNKFISIEEAIPVVNNSDIFIGNEDKRFAMGLFSPEQVLNYEPESKEQAYLTLRANVYNKRTGMLPGEVVRHDGTEIDEDDERSVHFAVYENRGMGRAAVFACMRFIEKGENGLALPIEDFFPEAFPEPAPIKSAEASRFIVCHDEARQAIVAEKNMMTAALSYMMDKGPILGVVEPIFEKSLKIIRVPVIRIAEPKMVEHYNDDNLGILIDKEKFASNIGETALKEMTLSFDSFKYWGNYTDKSSGRNLRVI